MNFFPTTIDDVWEGKLPSWAWDAWQRIMKNYNESIAKDIRIQMGTKKQLKLFKKPWEKKKRGGLCPQK